MSASETNNNNAMAVLLDLSKAFDGKPHKSWKPAAEHHPLSIWDMGYWG